MGGRLRLVVLACVLVLAGCGGTAAPSPTPSPVVARVGTTAITEAQLDLRVQSALTQVEQAGGPTNIPAMTASLRTKALQSLILDTVIAQDAAAAGVAATTAQVQAQVNSDASAVGGMSTLQTQLAQSGGSLPQLEDAIRSQLNEERLEALFAKQRADLVEQQLHAGASFATEARSMSDDTNTSSKGGDLGVITEGQLSSYDKSFVTAMKALPVGAYTITPVRDAGGYDILQVYAKTAASWSVRHILVSAPQPYTVQDRPTWFTEALFTAVAQLCTQHEIHVYLSGADPCSGAPLLTTPSPSAR